MKKYLFSHYHPDTNTILSFEMTYYQCEVWSKWADKLGLPWEIKAL